MAKPVKVAFNKNIVVLPLSAILPLRAVSFATKQSAKYLRIAHSMAEVGIIEPLIVAPMRQGCEIACNVVPLRGVFRVED